MCDGNGFIGAVGVIHGDEREFSHDTLLVSLVLYKNVNGFVQLLIKYVRTRGVFQFFRQM